MIPSLVLHVLKHVKFITFKKEFKKKITFTVTLPVIHLLRGYFGTFNIVSRPSILTGNACTCAYKHGWL